jgi:hypothetical protein
MNGSTRVGLSKSQSGKMFHSRLTRGRRSYLSSTASIFTITCTYFCLCCWISSSVRVICFLRTGSGRLSPLREAVRARGCGCGESCIPADRGREKSQSTVDGIFWKLWCNMTGVLLPVVQQAGIGLPCLPLDRARESRHAEMKFFLTLTLSRRVIPVT